MAFPDHNSILKYERYDPRDPETQPPTEEQCNAMENQLMNELDKILNQC